MRPSGLRNYIVYKGFTVQTLLLSLEFVIQNKSQRLHLLLQLCINFSFASYEKKRVKSEHFLKVPCLVLLLFIEKITCFVIVSRCQVTLKICNDLNELLFLCLLTLFFVLSIYRVLSRRQVTETVNDVFLQQGSDLNRRTCGIGYFTSNRALLYFQTLFYQRPLKKTISEQYN